VRAQHADARSACDRRRAITAPILTGLIGVAKVTLMLARWYASTPAATLT
jgi:hypothetical protein